MAHRRNTNRSNINNKGNKDQYEILIAGMGGEGVVFLGELLGLGATLDGKYASQRNTYGASQRGEAICSEIIISNEPVQFPFIESPTHFIALSKMGFDGYYYRLKNISDSTLFIDTSYEYNLHGLDKRANVIKIPARQNAIDNDMPTSGNIIILGSFIKGTKIISQKSIEQALSRKISKKMFKQNQKAIKIGYKVV
jgi:2-oxoglutarate ferredoxin oxidoreductase subunit gamma